MDDMAPRNALKLYGAAAAGVVVASAGAFIAETQISQTANDAYESTAGGVVNFCLYVAIALIVAAGALFAYQAATTQSVLRRIAGVAAITLLWASALKSLQPGLSPADALQRAVTISSLTIFGSVAAMLFVAWRRNTSDSLGEYSVGDVVWAEVPFHDDSGSKDRPLIVVGGRRGNLVCVYATSQSKVLGHPGTMSVGKGPWDSSGRETFVDVRKTFNVAHSDVRRKGGALPAGTRRKVVRLYQQQR